LIIASFISSDGQVGLHVEVSYKEIIVSPLQRCWKISSISSLFWPWREFIMGLSILWAGTLTCRKAWERVESVPVKSNRSEDVLKGGWDPAVELDPVFEYVTKTRLKTITQVKSTKFPQYVNN